MVPKQNRSPELEAKSQRSRIRRYVGERIIGTDQMPNSPTSFYNIRPNEDEEPEMAELYDQAGKDSTIFALRFQKHLLTEDMPDSYDILDEQLSQEQIAAKIAQLELLELQYVDPLNHPFNPLDS